MRISKRTIDTLLSQPAGTVFRDGELVGFQARLNANGSVTYAFEYRAGVGRKAPVRRLALGRHGNLTADEARTIAKEKALAVASGEDPAAARSKAKAMPSFRDFAEDHLDAMERIAERHPEQATLREGSIRNYRSLLKVHVGPRIGSTPLSRITKEEVARMHNSVGREKPATANRCLEFIGSVYRAANESGLVEEGTNPARGIRSFKERKRERFLSTGELQRLGSAIRIAETDGLPYVPPLPGPGKKAKHIPKSRLPYRIDRYSAAALRLLIFSGARLREILNARWCDVDLERGLLSSFGKTGMRHILLTAPALEVLSGLDRAGEYVIASSDPRKPKADLAKPWKAVCKLAGLNGVRIHDLRHSFASVAVGSGQSLLVVSKLLGHSDISMTQRYSHLADDPVRQAAERTAAQIDAAMGGSTAEMVALERRRT